MLATECIHAVEMKGPCKLYCVGWQNNQPTISSGPEMQIYMDLENRTVFDPWWLPYKDLTTQLTLQHAWK
jgi:hypothetical protein